MIAFLLKNANAHETSDCLAAILFREYVTPSLNLMTGVAQSILCSPILRETENSRKVVPRLQI